jgi:iron complex outermembrane receptor protein
MISLSTKSLGRALIACMTTAWAAVSPVCSAQVVESASGESDTTLKEVIVTALRRETKLSDTPIAISAITAEDIDHQRIVNFSDLQLLAPNFVFSQVTRQETFISMRGTSVNNDTPGSDTGVSVFIDGVPRTGVHDYNPDLFDLQSVEVLRGPQGTLFGRNTTGGAILIHTTTPSFQPMFRGQLTYGSDNLAELNALATGPLVADVLAAKIAVSGHHRDGNIDNVFQGRENGEENAGSARIQLLWYPRDDLKVLFSTDYLRDKSQSRVGQLEGTFVPSLFPTLQYGPDVTNSAFTPQASSTIVGVSATADWTLHPGTLTSITGYRSVTPNITYSGLGDPFTEVLAAQNVRDRQITEELHFASAAAGPLTYLVGLFYLHANRLDDTLYTINAVPGTGLSYTPGLTPGFQQLQAQSVLTESRAIFGEATYAVLDSLGLTLGGRYSSERRSGHSEVTPLLSSGPYSHTWSAFTPKFTLSYRPVTQVLTYATVAKGFQSGGYDAGAGTSEGLRTPFNPETVINYELGLKAVGFEKRLSTNVAAFLADYSNLQRTEFVSNPPPGGYQTSNAGKARVKGLEFDMTYLPAQWDKLGLAYAYMDARYREYLVLQSDGSTINYAGNTLPQSPKQVVHLSDEVTIPWAATGGSVIAGADYTYRSQIQFVDANDTPQVILDKTRYNGIVNLHAGWQSTSGNVMVNVFAKNISDKRALVNFPDFTPYFATLDELSNPQNHIYLARYSPGRVIGLTFTVKY